METVKKTFYPLDCLKGFERRESGEGVGNPLYRNVHIKEALAILKKRAESLKEAVELFLFVLEQQNLDEISHLVIVSGRQKVNFRPDSELKIERLFMEIVQTCEVASQRPDSEDCQELWFPLLRTLFALAQRSVTDKDERRNVKLYIEEMVRHALKTMSTYIPLVSSAARLTLALGEDP